MGGAVAGWCCEFRGTTAYEEEEEEEEEEEITSFQPHQADELVWHGVWTKKKKS
jgi:hypothetical protein